MRPRLRLPMLLLSSNKGDAMALTSEQQQIVDKATLTKVIKKLLALDYIKVTADEKDKRVKRLYITEKALPAARRIKEIHNSFYQAVCTGLSSGTVRLTEETLAQMVENVNQKIWHRMEV